QEQYDCLFLLVDLHAITVPQTPDALRNATREVTAAFIACGVDPEANIIFNQSAVSIHAELAWVLSCYTPLGWLNRMTQFKEKAGKQRDNALLGLYSYPVLMAADILGYKATHVPVGDDQKQHLELSRDIAGAFNRACGEEFFPLPEPIITGHATRVMSLRDGTKKMSKSDESEYSRINLTDDADTIAKKFKKAKSDAEMGFETLEGRPEAQNLLNLYAALAGGTVEDAQARFRESGFGKLKGELAEVAVEHLAPITREMRKLLDDPAYIDSVLKRGAEDANLIGQQVMDGVKDRVGFLRP
ncbi:MAG: tryptophan--tRNA ligase, partial [Rickettsiales bacterium]